MQEKSLDITGGILIALISAILGTWKIYLCLLALYVLFILINVLTGALVAQQSGTYSQDIAYKSYLKKVVIVLTVIAFMVTDWLLIAFSGIIGVAYQFPLISTAMVGYQIIHELVSIKDNAKKAGNIIPKFIDSGLEDAANKLDNSVSKEITGKSEGKE